MTVYGLASEEIPEGCIPPDAVTVVKVLDEDGDPAVYVRVTPNMAVWDAIGLLTLALDAERARAQRGGRPEDDDDGEG